jgi:hypothetical protein
VAISIVRLEALRALEALITLAIPVLYGRVCVDVAPSSEFEELPNLTMYPSRWRYEPAQALEQRTLPGNAIVWNVGSYTTTMVINIVAASGTQRAQLEAEVLNLFLSSRHPLTGMRRAGVLVVPVTSCRELETWLAAFELDSDEWINDAALSHRYESKILVTAIVPALVVERPVYTIETLTMHTETPPDLDLANIPTDTEVVTINLDGTISNA